MSRRKYRIGPRITSLNELAEQEYIYCSGKIMHCGWFMSCQMRTVKMYIELGAVRAAIKNDESEE